MPSDSDWFYVSTDKTGVRSVQAVEILMWNGSAATVVTSDMSDGGRALPVGRPTSVAAETLFRGKKNVPEQETN